MGRGPMVGGAIFRRLRLARAFASRPPADPEARYYTAAGRTLDAAHYLFSHLDEVMRETWRLRSDPQRQQDHGALAYGLAETAVVALHKSVRMVVSAAVDHHLAGPSFPAPPKYLVARQRTLRELRNSFEHIDERALGKGKPALNLFEGRLFRARELRYGDAVLCLDWDVPLIIRCVQDELLRQVPTFDWENGAPLVRQ